MPSNLVVLHEYLLSDFLADKDIRVDFSNESFLLAAGRTALFKNVFKSNTGKRLIPHLLNSFQDGTLISREPMKERDYLRGVKNMFINMVYRNQL